MKQLKLINNPVDNKPVYCSIDSPQDEAQPRNIEKVDANAVRPKYGIAKLTDEYKEAIGARAKADLYHKIVRTIKNDR